MQLPKLSPGQRFSMPRPVGSSDALLLAQLGLRDKAHGKVTAIVTASLTPITTPATCRNWWLTPKG